MPNRPALTIRPEDLEAPVCQECHGAGDVERSEGGPNRFATLE
jgi:hypothetical protein